MLSLITAMPLSRHPAIAAALDHKGQGMPDLPVRLGAKVRVRFLLAGIVSMYRCGGGQRL
jgi:hypothetical protein